MSRSISNARFAVVLAVVLALFVTGIVAGAAGAPLIIGAFNSAGATTTQLSSSANGAGLTVSQTGAGNLANAIRGDSIQGTGGVFTSGTNNALFATVSSPNRYGIVGVNTGAAGTGGAILAVGNANPGLTVDVDSNSVDPIEVNSTGLVDNLNSDMVDYFHANTLSRMAWAETEDAVDGGTLLTVNINAPVRGWFSIVASADSFNGAASDDFTCQVNMGGNYVGGSLRYVSLVDNANEEQDCSTNAAISTCGGDASFTLTTSGVNVGTQFDAATMQVSFTPFNGVGNQPSIFGCLIIIPSPPALKEGVDLSK